MTHATTTFSAARGTTKIVVWLYGAVTPERLEAEKKIAAYRAEQLSR